MVVLCDNRANLRLLASAALAGGGQKIVILSRLHFVIGVCLLAAALLMGGAGGAIAVADPDSSNSAAADGNGGTNASGQKKPKKEPAGTDTNQQQPSTSEKKPKKKPAGTDTKDGKKDPGLVAALPDVAPVTAVVAPVSDVMAPVSDVVAPVSDVVAPVSDVVAPVPNSVAPVSDVIAPVSDVIAPVSDGTASVPDMLTSVPGAAVLLTQLQSDLSSFLLGIAGAVVPALTQLQSDLSSFLLGIAGAVVPALTQLQSDLCSFFLGLAGLGPVVDGLGIDGAGRSAAADASVASQLPLVLLLAGVPAVPVAGNTTGVETPGGIAPSTFDATSQVGPASSLPGMAPPALNAAIPMGVRSFLRHAYREHPLPLAVSLSALAAVALPGAGGLVILTAAGVRIGYRQAKSGFALRATGIARFAGPGPFGGVRPRALRVVRPEALRVVRPEALSAGYLLEKVA